MTVPHNHRPDGVATLFTGPFLHAQPYASRFIHTSLGSFATSPGSRAVFCPFCRFREAQSHTVWNFALFFLIEVEFLSQHRIYRFNRCEVCGSVAFSSRTAVAQPSALSGSRTRSSSRKVPMYPVKQSVPIPPHPQPLGTTSPFCVCLELPILDIVYGKESYNM